MKVWVIDFEGVEVYNGGLNPLDIPFVKDELSYLLGGYQDEYDKFVADVKNAVDRGCGEAIVEERFTISLQDVLEDIE